MPVAQANGITICYEAAGDPAGPPVLAVMGLSDQLTFWPPEFIAPLVAAGCFVVAFDNRDAGLSTWFDEAGVPNPVAVVAGGASAPYLLGDMAADALGLLDALGLAAAHVVGVSMGGMIAQCMAATAPPRVLTLTSIMSTTGDPYVGTPRPEAVATLLAPAPQAREAAIDQSVEGRRVISSPGFAFDEARVRKNATAAYDRAHNPGGVARQLAAILGSGDRTASLAAVRCPTLVVHGADDPLVTPSGGEATAKAIAGAELVVIPGMGHDLHPDLCGRLAGLVVDHVMSRNRSV